MRKTFFIFLFTLFCSFSFAQIDKYKKISDGFETDIIRCKNGNNNAAFVYGLTKNVEEFMDGFRLTFIPYGEAIKIGKTLKSMCSEDIAVFGIEFSLTDGKKATLPFAARITETDLKDIYKTNAIFWLIRSKEYDEENQEFYKLLRADVKSVSILNGDYEQIGPSFNVTMHTKETLKSMLKDLGLNYYLNASSSAPSASTSKKQNTSKTTNSTTNKANSQNVNGHEYVDLGLKSGTMWATCNVGAKNPHEIGMYFAWGEVEGTYTAKKKNGKGFRADNYKYMKNGNSNNVTKYCSNDKKYTLEDSDDAASVNWGRSWCMPTYEQAKELVDNCTYSFVKVQGRTCIKLVSKINNRYIIIPCGGDAHFQEISSKDSCFSIWLKDRINWGSDGSAAHMNSVGDASAIYVHWNILPRYEGLNIRPVLKSTK